MKNDMFINNRTNYRSLDLKAKGALVTRIRHYLSREEAVIFAYIYGSFVEGGLFRDLDIALYINEGFLSHKGSKSPLFYELDMEADLEAILSMEGSHILVDVRLLNNAPLSFRYNVIKNGFPVFVRDDEQRVDFEVLTLAMYFDFAPFRRDYLREVLKLGIR